MDPLSITGFIITIAQSVGPIVSGIRTLRKLKDINTSVADSLEKSEAYSVKISLWLEAIGNIDEAALSSIQQDYLRRTLCGLKVAAASHAAEVQKLVQTFGVAEEVQLQHEMAEVQETQDNHSEITLLKRDSGDSAQCPENVGASVPRRKFTFRISLFSSFSNRHKLLRREQKKRLTETEVVSEVLPNPSESKFFEKMGPKITYLAIGEHNMKQLTSELLYWDNQLFTGFLMIANTLSVSQSAILDRKTHPVARFILQAKESDQRLENVTEISPDVWIKYYLKNMEFMKIDKNGQYSNAQFPLYFGNFVPKCDDPTDDVGNSLKSFRRCVYIDRGLMDASRRKISLALAASFSDMGEEEVEISDKLREDGDMLRCVAIANVYGNCVLLFKLPKGSSPNPMTLRAALRKSGGERVFHPISDRVKLAIRLSTGLFVLHSLGFVQKRINPEKIILVESASGGSSQSFPKRLGYPYFVAFHNSRGDTNETDFVSHFAEARKRGIYFHFRDQDKDREDKYSMKDDIYSLGVCLFEIALWRSLFIWSEKEHRDYVYDDSFVKLSDEQGKFKGLTNVHAKARAKTEELINAAEELIPLELDYAFTKAVVACLKVYSNDSPLADHPRLKNIRNGSSSSTADGHAVGRMECLAYLELVLQLLQGVFRGFADPSI